LLKALTVTTQHNKIELSANS